MYHRKSPREDKARSEDESVADADGAAGAGTTVASGLRLADTRLLEANPAEIFRRKYILALVLLAVISILSQIVVQAALAGGIDDGRLINIAGRQRMLSQKIARTSLQIADENDDQVRAALVAELDSDLDLLKSSHVGLVRGPRQLFRRGNSSAVLALYTKIEPYFNGIIAAAARLQDEAAIPGIPRGKLRQTALIIISDSSSFLDGMNAITFIYDRENRSRIDAIRLLELGFLALTLAALAAVAWLIFRPAELKMEQDYRRTRRTMEGLEERAFHDGMTGLFNRSAGLLILEREIQRVARTREPLTVCFVDIDGLKSVNDGLGHEAGDDLIRSFAALIGPSIRSEDAAFRYGGDEFVIVLSCDEARAKEIVARVHGEVERENRRGIRPYRLEYSVGILPYDPDSRLGAEAIVAQADKIMYEEKRRHKAESVARTSRA